MTNHQEYLCQDSHRGTCMSVHQIRSSIIDAYMTMQCERARCMFQTMLAFISDKG